MRNADFETEVLVLFKNRCSMNFCMQSSPPRVDVTIILVRPHEDYETFPEEPDYKTSEALRGKFRMHTGVSIHVQWEPLRTGFRSGDPSQFPRVVHDVLVAVASSGFTTAVYSLMKTWVDARNGRKLKIRVGEIEVEATQMAERDVLRIFELLQEKGERARIRELLLDAGKQQTPEGH